MRSADLDSLIPSGGKVIELHTHCAGLGAAICDRRPDVRWIAIADFGRQLFQPDFQAATRAVLNALPRPRLTLYWGTVRQALDDLQAADVVVLTAGSAFSCRTDCQSVLRAANVAQDLRDAEHLVQPSGLLVVEHWQPVVNVLAEFCEHRGWEETHHATPLAVLRRAPR